MDNIGEILKNTRLEKGLSLEQVEEATSIRKIYLAAVEENKYSKIPGDVFTKGIIRTYGNYLGLNGPDLVIRYKAACAGVAPEEIKPVEIRTTSKISINPHLKPQKSSRGIFAYLLMAILLVVIAASTYLLFFRGGNGSDAQPVVPQQSSSDSTNKIPEQEKAKIEADAKKAKERAVQSTKDTQTKQATNNVKTNQIQLAPPNPNGVNLYMYCNERCWIEVVADGKKVFEGTLVSNQDKTFSAEKKIVVKYGNIKSMQIAVNGNPMPAEKVDGVVVKEYKK